MNAMTIWGAFLMVSSCTGPAPSPGPAPAVDGGARGRDDGSVRMRSALRVESAWWRHAAELRTVVSVHNHGPDALDVSPERFAVTAAGGRRVHASDVALGGCAAESPLAPGGEARCLLRFSLTEPPSTVEHPSGEAPIPTCSYAHPFGLCGLDQGCFGGACRPLCSERHQDGLCADEDQVCQRGQCVAPCDDEDPTSGCDEGVCIEGQCSERCRSLAIRDESCWGCMWDVIDAQRCDLPEACRDCGDCPGTRAAGEPARTTCDCLDRPECDDCADAAGAYWQCLSAACPGCAE